MNGRLMSLAALFVLLIGCQEATDPAVEKEAVEELIKGYHRVLESAYQGRNVDLAGAFDSGKVYYIAQVMEEAPGGKKTPISRTIVTFTYDDKGIVTALDITDEETGRNVFHIDEKTPTPGDTYGILDQIFSNVSRAPASSQ